MKNSISILILVSAFIWVSCDKKSNESPETTSTPEKVVEQLGENQLPDWAVNANIYEVNIRQYTPEGTIAAFRKHLPRLKEMGVDILWLMPIHPISKIKRKGGDGAQGSHYAVGDYTGVTPDYGTLEEFKALVKEIHDQGMYVILDWVPNHTGWDNPWIEEHPDWYTYRADTIVHALNEKGELTDWTDVADLNYDNPDMRQAMVDALKFWVEECHVDGYRYDVAHAVPDDFWVTACSALKETKPVFLLGETEKDSLRNNKAFHATYGWSLHHIMNEVAKGAKKTSAIDEWLVEDRNRFNHGFHMHFTTNHDRIPGTAPYSSAWAKGTKLLRYLLLLLMVCLLFTAGKKSL